MLQPDEILELIAEMCRLAALDEESAGQDDRDSPEEAYWRGWGDGLDTLRQHILTGVKISCFPAGSCTCHRITPPRTV